VRYSSVKPSKAVILAREPAVYAQGPAAPNFRVGDWEAHAPALLPVANRPLLGHALDWMGAAGVRDVAVLTGDRVANEARGTLDGNWPFEPSWLVREPGESLGDSLGALTEFLDGEPFVLHLADSLARQSLPALLESVEEPDELEAVVVVHGSDNGAESVVDIRERLGGARGGAAPELGHSATAGVAVIGAQVAAEAADLDAWPGRELNALAERVNQVGGRVRVRRARGWWRFGRGTDAALDGNRFALEALGEGSPRGEVIDSRIQGAVSIHPSARVESSIVRGPAVIGAGVRLRDAYVGPYTSIGNDVVIEGAEIEHSIVMPGASIHHLGGRLEASVIGPSARVFRAFSLPRALRLTVGRGAEVSLP
jgi:glucose-1-phosphate thymidylyltransferase